MKANLAAVLVMASLAGDASELLAQQTHCTTPASSQHQHIAIGRTLLVHAEGEAYLLPTIVQKIEAARTAETGQRLFGDVVNVNRYIEATVSQRQLRDVLAFYTDRSYRLSSARSESAQRLELPDYFLSVRAHEVAGILEFQFSLYDRLPADTGATAQPRFSIFPEQNVALPGRTVNFLLDPRSSEYELTIDNAIARLFPETNHSPVPVLRTKRGYLRQDTFYVALGDTFQIDASASTDPDTPRERLRYFWRQVEPDCTVNPPADRALALNMATTAMRQHIVAPDTGLYRVALAVSDQITSSESAATTFRVLTPPMIQVDRNEVTLEQVFSLTSLINGASPTPKRDLRLWVSAPDTSDVLCVILESENEVCDSHLGTPDVGIIVDWRRDSVGFVVTIAAGEYSLSRTKSYRMGMRVRRQGVPSRTVQITITRLAFSVFQARSTLFSEMYTPTGSSDSTVVSPRHRWGAEVSAEFRIFPMLTSSLGVSTTVGESMAANRYLFTEVRVGNFSTTGPALILRLPLYTTPITVQGTDVEQSPRSALLVGAHFGLLQFRLINISGIFLTSASKSGSMYFSLSTSIPLQAPDWKPCPPSPAPC